MVAAIGDIEIADSFFIVATVGICKVRVCSRIYYSCWVCFCGFGYAPGQHC